MRGPRIHEHADRLALTLLGELGEIAATGAYEDAQTHLMQRARDFVGGAAVWWFVGKRSATGTAVEHSRMEGFDDWQLREWQQDFLEGQAYYEHPMWAGLFAGQTHARAHSRPQLVRDRAWYGDAYQALTQRLGMDDTLCGAVPIAPGQDAVLMMPRPFGDRPYGDRERNFLLSVQRALPWLHRQFVAARAGPVELATQRLPRRHRPVLEHLLTGRSEKEIAGVLGKSPRTVHKYVEQIYAAFHVSSRAELMALVLANGPESVAK